MTTVAEYRTTDELIRIAQENAAYNREYAAELRRMAISAPQSRADGYLAEAASREQKALAYDRQAAAYDPNIAELFIHYNGAARVRCPRCGGEIKFWYGSTHPNATGTVECYSCGAIGRTWQTAMFNVRWLLNERPIATTYDIPTTGHVLDSQQPTYSA